MRILLLALILPISAWATTPSEDGFIWIDANTRIKVKPTAAGTGSTAPQKTPAEEPRKDKKDQRKK